MAVLQFHSLSEFAICSVSGLSQKGSLLTDRHNLFDAISATQRGRAENKRTECRNLDTNRLKCQIYWPHKIAAGAGLYPTER